MKPVNTDRFTFGLGALICCSTFASSTFGQGALESATDRTTAVDTGPTTEHGKMVTVTISDGNSSKVDPTADDFMEKNSLDTKPSAVIVTNGKELDGNGDTVVIQEKADDVTTDVVDTFGEATGRASGAAITTAATMEAAALRRGTPLPRAVVGAGALSLAGVAAVTTTTEDCAELHRAKLLMDQSTIGMSGVITSRLMRRNLALFEDGSISKREMIERNDRLVTSARREGDKIAKEAKWIDDRYSNVVSACFGTVRDAWRHHTQ